MLSAQGMLSFFLKIKNFSIPENALRRPYTSKGQAGACHFTYALQPFFFLVTRLKLSRGITRGQHSVDQKKVEIQL